MGRLSVLVLVLFWLVSAGAGAVLADEWGRNTLTVVVSEPICVGANIDDSSREVMSLTLFATKAGFGCAQEARLLIEDTGQCLAKVTRPRSGRQLTFRGEGEKPLLVVPPKIYQCKLNLVLDVTPTVALHQSFGATIGTIEYKPIPPLPPSSLSSYSSPHSYSMSHNVQSARNISGNLSVPNVVFFSAVLLVVFFGLLAWASQDSLSSYSGSGGDLLSWYSLPIVGGGKYPVSIDTGPEGRGYDEVVRVGDETFRIESHNSYSGSTIVSNRMPWVEGGKTLEIDAQGKVSNYYW